MGHSYQLFVLHLADHDILFPVEQKVISYRLKKKT